MKTNCEETSEQKEERPAPSASIPAITPVRPRIGEGEGNLERREEHFRKRHGER